MKKYSETRPWGGFEQFTHNEISTVKILTIKKDERLSLQYHHNRDEFWRILKGKARITIGDEVHEGNEGDEFIIKKLDRHTATGVDGEVKILEISFGNFDEDDNIRLDDKYGRS